MERKDLEFYLLLQEYDCVEHGDLRDSRGLYEKELSACDIALRIDPEDAVALFDKGVTLKKMGKQAEGNRLVNQAVDLFRIYSYIENFR